MVNPQRLSYSMGAPDEHALRRVIREGEGERSRSGQEGSGIIPVRRGMAIRIRVIEGEMVALCAAKTLSREGDIYLGDAEHYALACKFARDHLGHRIDWNDTHNDVLAKKEEA